MLIQLRVTNTIDTSEIKIADTIYLWNNLLNGSINCLKETGRLAVEI
jgi:hypothetical protein